MPWTAHRRTSPLHVLVVGPRDAKTHPVTGILEKAGHAVLRAADARTALELAPVADAVVLDADTPKRDGLELLRRLKADPDTSFLPVVQLSGSQDIDDQVRSLEGGAVTLADPPAPAVLVATVRMLVREREASERVIEVLEQSGDAFLAVDASWRVLHVNRNQEQICRVSRGESVGRDFWELFPACAAPSTLCWTELHRALETRQPVAFEEYFPWLQRWLELRAFPARGNGLSIFLRDITARKQHEEAVRRSEQHAHTLIASLAEGVVVHAADGRLIQANPAAQRLLGLSAEQIRGRTPFEPCWRACREDGSPMPGEEHAASVTLRTGQPVTGQVMGVERPDGSRVWLLVNAHPVFGPQGEVSHAVASFFDLTAQREAEAERERLMRAAERERLRLAALVESIPMGILFAEAGTGRIDLHNSWAHRVFRTPKAPGETAYHMGQWGGLDADGQPLRPEEYGLYRALVKGETIRAEERSYLFDDGRRGILEVYAAPIRDESGAITGAVGVYCDITARKEGERAERRRAEFEQQLIGIVSHDLRNPIATVRMSAQLELRRADLDKRTRRALTRIASASERATRMIRDLLDFTRARLGGGIPITPAPLDLHGLAGQVVEELQLAHPTRRIRLKAEGSGAGSWDPDRLAQVLINLIENALHYSPEESEVTVRIGDDGDAVRIQIHNTGPAISEEELPEIFEPLHRGATRGEDANRSIGLGLYIVRQIVEAHRGRVWVSSSAEAGTCFSLSLPRSVGLQPDPGGAPLA